MSNKAVFVDRDKTLIEDPGYINDPGAINLLPGVELALKSLKQAGYLIVVVTNQSGIARGLLAEEALESIHAELRRQLGEKGAHVDAIYYCPYHPEGTVDTYAIDSDLRKPKPGMLVKAASELEIDLGESWMIGDAPHDVEAGQRAGCRTVRIRTPGAAQQSSEVENVQADYTVRNLVEGVRVILRAAPAAESAGRPVAASAGGEQASAEAEQQGTARPLVAGPREAASPDISSMSDRQARLEILRHVRQLSQTSMSGHEEFSITKLIGGIVQVLVLPALLLVLVDAVRGQMEAAQLWGLVSIALQVMALTFFIMQRSK